MVESIENYTIYALIVAGGKGLRMESTIRKQYIKIEGIPLLARTIGIFSSLDSISHIFVVVPEEDTDYCLENIILPYDLSKKVCLVSGGSERQQSVMNGLKKINEYDNPQIRDIIINKDRYRDGINKDINSINRDGYRDDLNKNRNTTNRIVLIHDGVRPFVDSKTINSTIEGALKYRACIPVIPVVDTLKLMDSNGFVDGIVDRTNLNQVQTPQAFELDLILKAHEDAILANFFATDDASLVERLGKKVFMTQGSKTNIKITTQEDLLFAKYIYEISRHPISNLMALTN
ncbi:MAG: 2-C-methyl-D-erythritol 4-phosphate cytidylyltransferase [Desulfamplus sp.]|nr:2-C-methyl-D-erythritol 4-phosphate cytidylyltransferase [Desulfamplus sp.]